MSRYMEVEVGLLVPPGRPMRTETLYEGMEKLKDSMSSEGLHQPIGVEEQPDGTMEIVWGMRRSIAAREMGWGTIAARVYQPGELDKSLAMAAENFQRTQIDPIEEGEYYAHLIASEHISQSEVARRCHRSPTHVGRILDLLAGQPEVLKAVREGAINQAQARELNLITDPIGLEQGLHYAKENGLSARFIASWRDGRVASGISESAVEVARTIAEHKAPDYQVQIRCQLHDGYVNMVLAPPRIICEECWQMILDALACYKQAEYEQRAIPPA